MLFKKEFLQYQEWDRTIEKKITSHGRWTVGYRVVFLHEGKFYMTLYTKGATEYQGHTPYDLESDLIECPEVVPVEKVVIAWEPIEEGASDV